MENIKTNYINIIKSSINNVIMSLSSESVNFGDVKILDDNIIDGDISVAISLVGDYKGTAYLSMGKTVSQNITSFMLGGMSITEIDDLVKSAVGEFCNMVMGGACSQLCNLNIMVDITPPIVTVGDNVNLSDEVVMIKIPVTNEELGELDFNFALAM